MDVRKRQWLLRELGITQWTSRNHIRATPLQAASETGYQGSSAAPLARVSASGSSLMSLEGIDQAPQAAAARSSVPADWAGLRAAVAGCTSCKLCLTRNKTVFGVGPENAPLMVIGEGPGAEEDMQGEPFVGRAGKLLDEMLKAIGCSRHNNTFITNIVKCRPPGNRDPQAEEAEACRPYLDQQIRLIQPKLIVGLGRVAAQRLLATEQPLAKLRSRVHLYGPDSTPVLLTYHPAYLLRSPREKAKVWADLKQILRLLESGA